MSDEVEKALAVAKEWGEWEYKNGTSSGEGTAIWASQILSAEVYRLCRELGAITAPAQMLVAALEGVSMGGLAKDLKAALPKPNQEKK